MPTSPLIGRRQELRRYKEFLENTSPWLWHITGFGGCGKTSLLYEMQQHAPADAVVVKIDFARDTHRCNPNRGDQLPIDPIPYLQSVVRQIWSNCNKQLREAFTKKVEEAQKLVSQGVPIYINSMTQTFTAAPFSSMSENRAHIDSGVNAILQNARQMARGMVIDAFYELMETFEPIGFVILLDTCEWLNDPVNEEVGLGVFQSLLLELHDILARRRRQFHVVMASSVPIELNVIEQRDCLFSKLEALDWDSVDRHLVNVGIQDPQMRRNIYEFTCGNACCISVISDLWQHLLEEERPTNIDELLDLQRTFHEEAMDKFVKKHVLDRRIKWPYDKLTHYGVLLRRFNQDILTQVFTDIFPEDLPPEKASAYYNQFINRPYVKHVALYSYSVHELLRMIMAEFIRVNEPALWKRYHEQALKAFTPPDRETTAYSVEQYYHTLACKAISSEEASRSFWQEALQDPKIDRNALSDAANDPTLMFTPMALAMRASGYLETA